MNPLPSKRFSEKTHQLDLATEPQKKARTEEPHAKTTFESLPHDFLVGFLIPRLHEAKTLESILPLNRNIFHCCIETLQNDVSRQIVAASCLMKAQILANPQLPFDEDRQEHLAIIKHWENTLLDQANQTTEQIELFPLRFALQRLRETTQEIASRNTLPPMTVDLSCLETGSQSRSSCTIL